jgi:chemotaxis protein methyltransferase CheR
MVPLTQPPPAADAETSDGFVLGQREFQWLRDFIQREAGIHIRENKQSLVAGRLSRRLRSLNLAGFDEYVDYVGRDRDGRERRELINCITTNKTDFFREEHHFDFLRETLFPAIRRRSERGGPRRLRIWSAGCSTGEEPYTLAMTIADHFGPRTGWDIKIVASDIDTQVLAKAAEGIYPEQRLEPISEALRQRHFQRGRDAQAGRWRVRPELRALIDFRHVNLNDTPWPLDGGFDAIFCRNVIIYFDKPTQQRLFKRFAQQLDPAGCLFIGHSESLIGVTDDFALIGRTIHRLRATLAAPRETERRIIVGEVFASREPTWVRTLLGSCVSACLFDPQARIGGMNHFLLPEGGPTADDPERAARFGVHAMELLINEIMRLGGQRDRLTAKLFGAAHVLSQIPSRVPDQNAQFVRDFLRAEGIRVVADRMGGSAAQEVRFDTSTGRAQVRFITPGAALASEEAEARSQFDGRAGAAPVSQVTLF